MAASMNRTPNPRTRSRAAIAAMVTTALATAATATAAQASPSDSLSIGPVRVGSKVAPLVLPVSAGRDAELSLRVNGHPVHDAFHFVGHRLHLAELSSTDGLDPGSNTVRVRALTGAGTATAARRVRVPRSALFADAGPEKGTTVAAVSQVGAEPAGPGAIPGVHRKWRVLKRPDGAHFTLQHRHASQPLLRASTPGTYVLQLTTRLQGRPQASYDTVTVPVSPPDPPIGAPIDSLDAATGAIVIDGKSYGASSDVSHLAYAVLERTTRAVVASGDVAADDAGIAKLAGLADTYGKDDNLQRYIMIVSGRHGVPAAQRGAFSAVAQHIGASLFTPQNFQSLADGQQFSIIGIPGAPAGAATVRLPVSSDPPVSGSITGYLQKNQAIDADGTNLYDYASPNHPIYDTQAAGSTATDNVITVGDKSYDGRLTHPGTAGFHVVVLNPLTLNPVPGRSNLMLKTNVTYPDQDPAWQAAVAGNLKHAVDTPGGATILLQTVGKPTPAGPEWNDIVDQLSRLGANRQLLNALDGETEYSLVGTVGSDQPPAEASTAIDEGISSTSHPQPAHLRGVLTRDRTSMFEPSGTEVPTPTSPDGGVNLDLIKIAYQPLQSWPQLAPSAPPAESAAAEQFICTSLKFCQAKNSCPDMRSCYWQKPGSDWTQKHSDLVALKYPDDAQGFSSPVFTAVKDELLKEMSAVANVQFYLTRITDPLVRSEGRSYVDLQNIAQTVWDSVQRPTASSSSPGLGIVASIAGIFALLEDPIGQAGAGLSAALTFAGSFSDDQGEPILGDDIKAKASELGDALFHRIDLARHETAGLGLLLVSDYGKLMAADGHIDSDWSLPSPTDDSKTVDKLRIASKQWFYEALVPVAYPYLIRGNANNARNMDCKINTVTKTEAWPNQPDDAQMLATTGYDNGGNPVKSIFFFTRGIRGGSSPPAGLADDIFRPRGASPPGLGVDKLSFFTPQVFNGQITHAVKGTSWCDVGWLPQWP